MTTYEQIISELKEKDLNKAEFLNEEIDIIIHKLKFLPQESLFDILILKQDSFSPIYNDILAEKVKLAGGNLVDSITESADKIIVLKKDERLFSEITSLIASDKVTSSKAYKENQLFIIQKTTFNTLLEDYLEDVEILAEIIQPKYFFYGHNGENWLQFEL